MNKSNSNYKDKGGLKEKNDVDQNVRPRQQPGKPAPPKTNEPGGKPGVPWKNKDAEEQATGDATPDEFKTPAKANKEARKILENESFHREDENNKE